MISRRFGLSVNRVFARTCAMLPPQLQRRRCKRSPALHPSPIFVLLAGTGVFAINPATASFGSFAPGAASARSYTQNNKGQYLSGGLTITLDIVEGAADVRDFDVPVDFTRAAVVEGLNASANETTAGVVLEALNAVKGLTGDIGTYITDYTYPTYLARFSTELLSATSVKVKITYRSYPLPVYEFDTCLNQMQTNMESDHQTPIMVYYTYPASNTLPDGSYFPFDVRLFGQTQPQNSQVPLPLFEPVVTIKFTVIAGSAPTLTIEGKSVPVSGSATNIVTALKMLEGHVANAPVSIGQLYGDARCWIFEKVAARSKDAGQTYEVVMTIHLRKNGWDSTATFSDIGTGLPPPDLVSSGQLANAQYQPPVLPDCVFPSWLFANLAFWSGSS